MSGPDAVARMRTALDELAAALESGEPDAVLAAEAPLATAVGAFSTIDRQALANDPRIGSALLEMRLTIARCRSLGRSAADLGAAMLPQTAYGLPGSR